MSVRLYLRLSCVVFAGVGLLHVLRLLLGVRVLVNFAELPMWLSWPGAIATLTLSVWALVLSLRRAPE